MPQFISPEATQYYNESSGAIQAQSQIIPQAIAAENWLMPEMQDYQARTLKSQSQSLLGIYGNIDQMTAGLQQQAGLAAVNTFGAMGNAATNAAVGSLSPWAQQNYNTFGQQAANDLALGSGLNEQETMFAQQSARAAMAARGLTGNQAVGQEVLNTYQLGNQRLQQRQQASLQAHQMATGQQQFGAQAYLQPAMNQSSYYSSPAVLGMAQQSFEGLGPQFIQPESQYIANIRAGNIAQRNADAAARATRSAGVASGIGALAGGLIALCWVAREAYGKDNSKWTEFRSWMLTEAPDWFFNLYKEHGEKFAEFISDKPFLKKMVRIAMDFILEKNKKKHSNLISNNA